jgi:hypothetical protein
MLITRYFISALPAIIISVAIGFSLIKSRLVYTIIGFIFISASFVDLFIVRDYYDTVTKTQFREITDEVRLKNKEKAPIVYRRAWHMEHFFGDDFPLVNTELDTYLNRIKIRNNNLENFWAIGAHQRPFKVTKPNQTFLNQNFYLVEEIEYYDCWARYYIAKDKSKTINLNLVDFTPKLTNKNSELVIKNNSTISSKTVFLEKGEYRLSVKTKSTPNPPIGNENAHIDVSISGNRIGGFFTSANKIETTLFDFTVDQPKEANIQFTFGNDFFDIKKDRDLIIYGVSIEKLN